MREFDHNGLLLAEYQGKLFEGSVRLECSSPIFIRRFLHSDLLKKLDKGENYLLTLNVNEGLRSIEKQFGNTTYGTEKYSSSAMFWMGYMYRYIAYTREQDTSFVMEIFDYKQMREVYYSYHTQSPEWCIRNLLELNHISEDIFDKNSRLREIMRRRKQY